MKISLERLPARLEGDLAGCYVVSGDEALLTEEAADAIRAAARAMHFADRQVFFVDKAFDWDLLRSAAESLSLFSERRILELRLPTGKPDKGAALLQTLIEKRLPDTLILVLTEKLDRKTADAPWLRAAERHGVWLPIAAVSADALPAWLLERARRSGLSLDADAAELIAVRVEGNLLAAAQEIAKLALLTDEARIDLDLVIESVGDSARFDVFELSKAAAAGNTRRALAVLEGLKGEGIEPTLIMWALGRELRGLWQARERQRLRSNERGSAWNLVSPPSPQTLAHARDLPLAALMQEAAHVDRVIKGAARGEAWSALRGLTAGLSGALQRSMLSG